MNVVRTFTLIVVRNYGRRLRRRDAVGIQRQLALAKQSEPNERNLEDYVDDPDDPSMLETDFANLDKFHDIYEREIMEKRIQLQCNITARKYFKKIDPTFLTYAECDKIKEMHNENPDFWTPKRLSEKFPALPENIVKVLKAKWAASTVDRIVQYDKKVAENWRRFYDGKLAVDLRLREHLNKFGKRKIDLEHSKNVAKYIVVPVQELPKPKQQIFSNIAAQLIGVTEEEPQQKLLLAKENKSYSAEKDQLLQKTKLPYSEASRKQTLDQFIERNYKKIAGQAPEQENTLFEAYSKHHKRLENKREKRSESPMVKSSIAAADESLALDSRRDVSMNTIVISKKELIDSTPTYIYPIKIPKSAYQKGKLYRIDDCYYDDDGEFLYRVPGIKP